MSKRRTRSAHPRGRVGLILLRKTIDGRSRRETTAVGSLRGLKGCGGGADPARSALESRNSISLSMRRAVVGGKRSLRIAVQASVLMDNPMVAMEREAPVHTAIKRATIWATVLTGFLTVLVSCDERSSTTAVKVGDTEIIFSVRWGWGMMQSIGAARNHRIISQQEEDVWKKPYDAGGPVYADNLNNIYYIALLNGLYRIDVGAAKITKMCQLAEEIASTLEYVGQFGLRDLWASERGDGVVFTPAGTAPPVQNGVKPELASLTSGRCG